jgi:arylsulfatase A-like enzyme
VLTKLIDPRLDRFWKLQWGALHACLKRAFCLQLLLLLASCAPRSGLDETAEHTILSGLESPAPTWVESFAGAQSTHEDSHPHVILISLDTLRADHLGAWGYNRPTSPFLDELARFGVRFDQAISHSPKTAPSHMSVFTGVHPRHHGAHFKYSTSPPTAFPVRRDLETLPEVMQKAGYRTAAWTGGGQVSRKAGFDRGFDSFEQNLATLTPAKIATILAWFRSNSDQRCFLFIHTYQIHDPYLPPPPYNEIFTDDHYRGWVIGDRKELRRLIDSSEYRHLNQAFWRKTGRRPDPAMVDDADLQHLLDLYDGNIRYTDDVLHGFFRQLVEDSLLADTLVIVFSDHGEEFLEHGGFLHEKLYRETLHVPLLFFWPGGLPRGLVVEAQVPLMDLAPTLLELVGLQPMAQSEATSLVPMLTRARSGDHRVVFSERPWVQPTAHRSFRDGQTTVIDYGGGQVELYDADSDLFEGSDLADARPREILSMLDRMTAFIESLTTPDSAPTKAPAELNEEETEALRALGYVE